MARLDSAVAGHRLEQSLQAAARMLAICSGAADPPRAQAPAVPAGGPLAGTSRKCRSVQFGLPPGDFQRLRKVSEQLGWSRAELARRCLLLVIRFLEERYPELQSADPAPLAAETMDAEQLSLWPALSSLPGMPEVAAARPAEGPGTAEPNHA